jgi:hypothetical protein
MLRKVMWIAGIIAMVACKSAAPSSLNDANGGGTDAVYEAALVATQTGEFQLELDGKKAKLAFELEVFGSDVNSPSYALWSTTIVESEFGDDLTADTDLRLENEVVRCPCFHLANRDVLVRFKHFKGLSEIESIDYFGLGTTILSQNYVGAERAEETAVEGQEVASGE